MIAETRSMTNILIAGSGGQGVLLIGKIFAQAAFNYYPNVSFVPSYSAEVRGGISSCKIVISNEFITSTCFEKADLAIIMNNTSLKRFINTLSNKTIVIASEIVNRLPSLKRRIINIPAVSIAQKLNNIACVNFVLLGAIIHISKIVPIKQVCSIIEKHFSTFPIELISLNIKALMAGENAAMKFC